MDAEHQNVMYNPEFILAVNERRRQAEARRAEDEAKALAAAKADFMARLKARVDDTETLPTIRDIARYVSELHCVPLEQMTEKTGHTRQDPRIEQARFAAIVLIHEKRPKISARRIGMFFNRDHSSVLNILWKYAKVEKYRGPGPRPEGFARCA